MRKGRMLSTKLVGGFCFCITKFQIIVFPFGVKLIIVIDYTGIDFLSHPPLQDMVIRNLEKRLAMPLARLLCIGEYLCNILFLPIVKVRIKSA